MTRDTLFKILGIIGVMIIFILAFTIPKDPYIIIPSISMFGFDKPLWLNIIIVGVFFYLMALFSIYDYLEERG